MKNKIIMRKVNAEFLQKKKKKGANQGRKAKQKNRGEEEKFSELGLSLFSRFFFYTYNYFPAASRYKIKRSLFTNKFLEYYVGPQHTHIFTYHKPRLAKHNQSKR
jgi:hypothetical protein